jgi:hypothetical protein
VDEADEVVESVRKGFVTLRLGSGFTISFFTSETSSESNSELKSFTF